MSGVEEADVEQIKIMLRKYSKKDLIFNEPHFTNQLLLREGNLRDVVENLLDPKKLVYAYLEEGKYGDLVCCLHFKVSSSRTLRLPVIFDKGGKKCLYIITYIMRYRSWKNMVRRGGRKR